MAFLFPQALPRPAFTFSSSVLEHREEKVQFWGQATRLCHSKASRLQARAAKLDFWQLLGGRGLRGGEEALREELKKQTPSEQSSDLAGVQPKQNKRGEEEKAANLGNFLSIDEKSFDKELMGMTGGFPGGEKGLRKFLEENPPPRGKQSTEGSSQLQIVKERLSSAKPKAPPLPLLLPGMIVIVKNPKHPYYMFCGIVQRITDGKVAVLFEGGNWDKLITFQLEDLERRAKGPPMTNPKSAILESSNNP